MKKMRMFLAASAAAVLLTTSGAWAGGTPLTTTRVAFGLNRPIGVFHAPGDFSRVFVTEKRGVIRIIKDGVLLVTPFMNIDPVVGGNNTTNSEQGLLGLAFHPDYQNNGFFYVNYTNTGGTTTISRYSVTGDPDIADPGTGDVLLLIGQPQGNHNGGWIDFGPNDGYLYIATGDGGGAFDQHGQFGNGQNLNTLLGKMLRIDIDGDDFPGNSNADYAIPSDNPFADGGGLAEIWAYGLRNPWRSSFDSATGDLYIGDVGQGSREEIDYQPASSSGGENYGWRCMEGTICTGMTGCVCNSSELVLPIHNYTHGFGISVTGGYVYRGCAIPDLRGTYFFGDYGSARIWSFRYDGTTMTEFEERTTELAPGGGLFINNLASFGTDAYGEIYICDQSGGEIFKLIPDTGGPANDCNSNGVEDGCETADGTAADCELDEIPDECQPVRICQAQGAADQTRPFTGYIDPRRESDNGVDVNQGLDRLTMVFSEPVFSPGGADVTTADFVVTGTGGAVPTVAAVDATANPRIEITLSGIIALREWTTIQAIVENGDGDPIANVGNQGPGVMEPDRVDIAFLPANVNQDGAVTPFDLLAFRQLVNGVITPEIGTLEDVADIDRSGAVSPFDLLALRQLINGVSPPATMAWNGESMQNTQP